MKLTVEDLEEILKGDRNLEFPRRNLAVVEKLKRRINIDEVGDYILGLFDRPELTIDRLSENLKVLEEKGILLLLNSALVSRIKKTILDRVNLSFDINPGFITPEKLIGFVERFPSLFQLQAKKIEDPIERLMRGYFSQWSFKETLIFSSMFLREIKNDPYLDGFPKETLWAALVEMSERRMGMTDFEKKPLTSPLPEESRQNEAEKEQVFHSVQLWHEFLSRLSMEVGPRTRRTHFRAITAVVGKAAQTQFVEKLLDQFSIESLTGQPSKQEIRDIFEIHRIADLLRDQGKAEGYQRIEKAIGNPLLPMEVRVIALDYYFENLFQNGSNGFTSYTKNLSARDLRVAEGFLLNLEPELVNRWIQHYLSDFSKETETDRPWRDQVSKRISKHFGNLKYFRRIETEVERFLNRFEIQSTRQSWNGTKKIDFLVETVFRFYYDPQPVHGASIFRGNEEFEVDLKWIDLIFNDPRVTPYQGQVLARLRELGAKHLVSLMLERLKLEVEGGAVDVLMPRNRDHVWIKFDPHSDHEFQDQALRAYAPKGSMTEAFEFSPTHLTYAQWNGLVHLVMSYEAPKIEKGKVFRVRKESLRQVEPSKENHAVVGLPFRKSILPVLMKLNQLLELNRSEIHDSLREIFPSHRPGTRYRLPTEAEWNLVATDLGRRDVRYAYGNYSWMKRWFQFSNPEVLNSGSGSTAYAVDATDPIFINFEPIWGLHGDLAEMVTLRPLSKKTKASEVYAKGKSVQAMTRANAQNRRVGLRLVRVEAR